MFHPVRKVPFRELRPRLESYFNSLSQPHFRHGIRCFTNNESRPTPEPFPAFPEPSMRGRLNEFTINRTGGPDDSDPMLRAASRQLQRITRDCLRRGQLFSNGPKACNVDPISLRKACTCSRCVDPSDMQKNYSSADIPLDISVQKYEIDNQGNYTIMWENDIPGFNEHTSFYTAARVSQWGQPQKSPNRVATGRPKFLWDKESHPEQEVTIPYPIFMAEPAMAIHHLWRTGLVFISDVPKEESSVQKVAEQIGVVQNTFYGLTWDVKSVPNAKNVAYTSRHLDFHMDLLYMAEPPKIQLLHCLENSCAGGESRFADTFKAIDRLLSQPEGPGLYSALENFEITYSYRNDGHHYQKNRTTISHLPIGIRHYYHNAENFHLMSNIRQIYYSPPFEHHEPKLDSRNLKAVTKARRMFEDILQSDGMAMETKLPAGTCAIFDNLRIVHARNAFDVNSGRRWLRGAYVTGQSFLSTMIRHLDRMPPDRHDPTSNSN